ncbi:MAG: helix-turn-helix transcriptional regulator [Usitatibacter sp.]
MNSDLRAQFVNRRLELGLTQDELAARANTTRKTISTFELGYSSLQLSTFQRLLAAMGLELATRQASSRPTLDELANRYSDDLGAPEGNRRIKRSKKR